MAMSQFLRSLPHKCQNIPTTSLAPAPPKLHSSVKIQLKKKNVHVSPFPLSPRELKPWSQLPGFEEGPSQALPTGWRGMGGIPLAVAISDDESYIHTGRVGVRGQSRMRWGSGP